MQGIEQQSPLINEFLQSSCCSNGKKRASKNASPSQASRQPLQLPSYGKDVQKCQTWPTGQVEFFVMLGQEAWYVLFSVL